MLFDARLYTFKNTKDNNTQSLVRSNVHGPVHADTPTVLERNINLWQQISGTKGT